MKDDIFRIEEIDGGLRVTARFEIPDRGDIVNYGDPHGVEAYREAMRSVRRKLDEWLRIMGVATES